MKLIVVGNGAREHALAWKLAQSPRCGEIIIAPGNAGTGLAWRNEPVSATDVPGIVALAKREKPDLVVVGPEDPLARGMADALSAHGIPCFGPLQAGAHIEASKRWAKELMRETRVPTARAEVFTTLDTVIPALEEVRYPVVIKADGLAAGKGVMICGTRQEAEAAARDCLQDGAFGVAGQTVLIEEFLTGDEASVLALVDGETVVPLMPARDHKRAGDGDTGPNTGGMGAYAPTTLVDGGLLDLITETILKPTARAFVERGITYRGILYAGLMLTPEGPQVIEFNCRMGDPETQVVLPLLDADLLTLFEATAQGGLASVAQSVQWHDGACVGVVLASGGYPGKYDTGIPISGLDAVNTDALVFHAGTKQGEAGQILTNGGRVLTVAAVAPTLQAARARAYANAERITFPGVHIRHDIAAREL